MPALPSSLSAILSLLQPAFTAPTFQIFGALVHGFLGRVGEHTVTGMWQAARLAGRLHHSRAHDFFARVKDRENSPLTITEIPHPVERAGRGSASR